MLCYLGDETRLEPIQFAITHDVVLEQSTDQRDVASPKVKISEWQILDSIAEFASTSHAILVYVGHVALLCFCRNTTRQNDIVKKPRAAFEGLQVNRVR